MFPLLTSFTCLFFVSFFPVDIISATEFDRSGDHLATGDRGGRVVLFERTDTLDVCSLSADVFLFIVLKLCCSTPCVA